MRFFFDRGTIVLEDVAAGVDPARLPGMRWDARAGAWRAPAYLHGALGEAVAEALAGGDGRWVDEVRPALPAPGPWGPVQSSLHIDDALWAWELAGRRGVVALPPGAGKARVALCAMARTGLRTMCLVRTRALVEAWAREIGAASAEPPSRLDGGPPALAPVTVSTYAAAWRWMAAIGARFDLLVVEEAQHFGGGPLDAALERSIAPARLGLTVAPPRGPAWQRRLAALLGPTVYALAAAGGDRHARTTALPGASAGSLFGADPPTRAGAGAPSFDAVTLYLDLTPAEREAYAGLTAAYRTPFARYRSARPGARWEDFARAAARTPEGRAALEAWRAARRLLGLTAAKRAVLSTLLRRHRQAATIVLAANVATACTVARAELIMPLTSDVGRVERADVLARFRRGELRALVAARVPDETADFPEADVVIVLGGLGPGGVAGPAASRAPGGAPGSAPARLHRAGRLLRAARSRRRPILYELVTRGTAEAPILMTRPVAHAA